MIRDEDRAAYLKCLAEELNATVQPELQSAHAKGVVGALGLMLGRMIAEAEGAQDIAREEVALWSALAPEAGVASTGNPLVVLDERIAALQKSLQGDRAFDALVSKLGARNPETMQWFQTAASGLNGLLQGIEDSFYRPVGRHGAASVADNLVELLARLNAYLRQRFPVLREDPVETLKIAPGGQIKRTAMLRLKPNPVLPERLVLRQDMPMNFTGTVITDEYKVIERVHALGLPVPKPILVEADPGHLGGRFMLMTEIENAVQAGTYFIEERAQVGSAMGPEIGHEMAGVLARLHSGTLEANLGAIKRAAVARNNALKALHTKWQTQPKPGITLGIDLGLAWLMAHPLPDDRPFCLTHGDIGAHNLLTRDGHLAALLDWELASMGDPADDLAQAKMMLLPDTMPWEAFKASYLAQGGPAAAVEDSAVNHFAILMFLRHGSMNVDLWSFFVSGQRDDAAAAAVASHFLDRLALYGARALAQAAGASDNDAWVLAGLGV
jgi:aminoglycoside phosphotransferase (APT) family kinase protein